MSTNILVQWEKHTALTDLQLQQLDALNDCWLKAGSADDDSEVEAGSSKQLNGVAHAAEDAKQLLSDWLPALPTITLSPSPATNSNDAVAAADDTTEPPAYIDLHNALHTLKFAPLVLPSIHTTTAPTTHQQLAADITERVRACILQYQYLSDDTPLQDDQHQSIWAYYVYLLTLHHYLQSHSTQLSTILHTLQSLTTAYNSITTITTQISQECSELVSEIQQLQLSVNNLQVHYKYIEQSEQIAVKLRTYDQSIQHSSRSTSLSSSSGGVRDVSPLDLLNVNDLRNMVTQMETTIQYMSHARSSMPASDYQTYKDRFLALHSSTLRAIRLYVYHQFTHATKNAKQQLQRSTHSTAATPTNDDTLLTAKHQSLWFKTYMQLRSVAGQITTLTSDIHQRIRHHTQIVNANNAQTPTYQRQHSAASNRSDSSAAPASNPTVSTQLLPKYRHLLIELYQLYYNQRQSLLNNELSTTFNQLMQQLPTTQATPKNNSSVTLADTLRNACTALLEAGQLEAQLFSVLFGIQSEHAVNGDSSPQLDAAGQQCITELLSSCASVLYTTLRPAVIREQSMAILADCCMILKYEVLMVTDDSQSAPPIHITGMQQVITRLLADLQERVVAIATQYIRDEIGRYVSKPEDVEYPEKLERIRGDKRQLTDGNAAVASSSSSAVKPARPTDDRQPLLNNVNDSDTDSSTSSFTATWHPVLERTLLTLSQLYRSLDAETFRIVASDAVSVATAALLNASKSVAYHYMQRHQASPQPTPIVHQHATQHSLLFLVQHLLIMREQLQPFGDIRLTSANSSSSLDFSHMLKIIPAIFTGGKNSSFMEIVNGAIAGSTSTPSHSRSQSQLQQQQNGTDARKQMESELKRACEAIIAIETQALIGQLITFFGKLAEQQDASNTNSRFMSPDKMRQELLKIVSAMIGQQPLTALPTADEQTPDVAAAETNGQTPVVPITPTNAVAQQLVQTSPFIQQLYHTRQLIHLYIYNVQTERIVHRPIRRAVVDVLGQLKFFVQSNFGGSTGESESAAESGNESGEVAWLIDSIQLLESVSHGLE